jgi:hypothetical protein
MRRDLKQAIKKHKITSKELIGLATVLGDNNFSIIALGEGLILKDDFLTPCIILAPLGMPKIRLNGEKSALRIYFKKYKKDRVEDFTAKEYTDYLNFAEKAGETTEYKKWRDYSKKIVLDLDKKIKRFNLINKNTDIKLSILRFTDGCVRLDFGNQKKEEIRNLYKDLSLNDKKNKMKKMFVQFLLFKKFLLENKKVNQQ